MKLKNKPLANIIGVAISLGLIIAPIAITTSLISSKKDEPEQKITPKKEINIELNITKKTLPEVKAEFNNNIKNEWKQLKSLNDTTKNTAIKSKVETLSNSILDNLNKNIEKVQTTLKDVVSEEQLIQITNMYSQASSILNKKLKDILDSLIVAVNNDQEINDGLAFVKGKLNVETLNNLKFSLVTVLDGNLNNIKGIEKSVFNSLKENESTKNIAVLDTFIEKMNEFYNTEIKTLITEIQNISFDNLASEGIEAQVAKFKTVLDKFKEDSRVKAHELLTNEEDYNTIKGILYPKFETLFNVALQSETLLKEKTKELVEIINTIIK
ncbi:hypothetical protein KQ875_01960 [Mycoplasma zalophi]|uniref:Uncharacterized protein n=1 Tax=Mycoplasma zalophi TaxID=191287 RepID=A0ABS6DPW0_9MOLU|nr:hypothetical protein [Mycoplasma zalophi]MBU4692359.1 hypothetical protein [Mycoplasma zalophi]